MPKNRKCNLGGLVIVAVGGITQEELFAVVALRRQYRNIRQQLGAAGAEVMLKLERGIKPDAGIIQAEISESVGDGRVIRELLIDGHPLFD